MSTMERIGFAIMIAAIVSCLFNFVDFEALPKALDKLTVGLPILLFGFAVLMIGQRLRFQRDERAFLERMKSEGDV